MGEVEFKHRDLGSDRGYRVAIETSVIVVVSCVRLDLNPHPLKPKGAAPFGRFRLCGWTRIERDALAGRGGEIFSGNSAYGRVEAKVQVLWLHCGGGCRYGYYFYVCA